MAHEIVKMFAVGQKTWHGLETLLDTPPLTVEEVLHYSGMGLKVEKVPAKVFINGTLQTIPDLYAVVREDGQVVGHAGEKWRAFQDRQFVELMHSYVDAGLGEWETGGVLSEGSRVFGLIKLKGIDSEIVKNDKVYPYILGTNGHTTGISTAMMPTVTRVVCRNTLRIAERQGKQAKIRFTVRHSQLTKQRVEEMKREVDAIALAFLETSKVYQAMAGVSLDSLSAKKYLAGSFGKWSETEPDKVAEYFKSKQGERLLELFETGRGVDIQGVRGTLWGAYNAVTEYLTHDAGRTFSSRFESGNFGLNATINAKALNLAQEMMVA